MSYIQTDFDNGCTYLKVFINQLITDFTINRLKYFTLDAKVDVNFIYEIVSNFTSYFCSRLNTNEFNIYINENYSINVREEDNSIIFIGYEVE